MCGRSIFEGWGHSEHVYSNCLTVHHVTLRKTEQCFIQGVI